MCSLKLGFYYHLPCQKDKYGKLKTFSNIGVFIDSLASYCTTIECFLHSPRADELPFMDYTLKSSNIHFTDLGPHYSTLKRMLNANSIVEPIYRKRYLVDAVLIRGPSVLLPKIAQVIEPTPTVLLLVGDAVASAKASRKGFIRKAIVKLIALLNQYGETKTAESALVFVNSRVLLERLRSTAESIQEVPTTTLRDGDIFFRADTCSKLPYRILYTGRFDHAKGILQMIEAVALLRKQGYEVVLDLVGWARNEDPIVEEARVLASNRGIEKFVIDHGFKSIGPDLFYHYIAADIYLIASEAEGFPRTIWEAFAHSLPVISTRVGAIPYYLTHKETAFLIENNDPITIADAIVWIIEHNEERQTLIKNGRMRAQQNTLNKRAREMITEIELYVARKNLHTIS